MAKIQKLQERGIGATIYPETIAEAVYFSDGSTAEMKVEQLQQSIDDKQDSIEVSEDLELSDGRLSVTERAKRAVFNDMWAAIGGVRLDNGNYRMGADGKELTYEEALIRYERNGFIDRWNEACITAIGYWVQTKVHGRYNESTGYFELNGLVDITYEQAIVIFNAGKIRGGDTSYFYYDNVDLRTNLPVAHSVDLGYACFYVMRGLEVISVADRTVCKAYSIYRCGQLHRIIGSIDVREGAVLLLCSSLEEAYVYTTNGTTLELNHPRFNKIECIRFSVEKTTKPCIINVNPEVYAKLTGDMTNEAAAALSEEEAAQWQQVFTDAAAKNITFATT